MHKCRGKKAKDSLDYWDARLKRMGCSMEAGRKIGNMSLTYGHDVLTMDYDGRRTYQTGERLDFEEWPVSL